MFFLFYLALGASVFSAIESPIEQKEIKDLIEKKKAFLSANKCIQGKYMIFQYARFLLYNNKNCLIQYIIYWKSCLFLASSLDDLINAIVEADNRGVTLAPMADPNHNVSVPSWSFGQSFFFASTVVTTIGN